MKPQAERLSIHPGPRPTCKVEMELDRGISFAGDEQNDTLQAESERKSPVQD